MNMLRRELDVHISREAGRGERCKSVCMLTKIAEVSHVIYEATVEKKSIVIEFY